MKTSEVARLIDCEVDRLFREHPPAYDQYCRNPVTGAGYVGGRDPTEPQKRAARCALLAREWFYLHGPRDAPPLPLSHFDIPELKYTDALGHMVSQFANSLHANKWQVNNHPSFEEFVRGVLASEYASDFVLKDEAFCRRYSPRPLRGLQHGPIWRPEH